MRRGKQTWWETRVSFPDKEDKIQNGHNDQRRQTSKVNHDDGEQRSCRTHDVCE